MAATTGGGIAQRLLDAGRDPDEPTALIHAATTERQTVARMTLTQLAEQGSPFDAPTTIVIGPTTDPANLRVTTD